MGNPRYVFLQQIGACISQGLCLHTTPAHQQITQDLRMTSKPVVTIEIKGAGSQSHEDLQGWQEIWVGE